MASVGDRFRERLSETLGDWTGKTVVDRDEYGSLVTKERLYEDLATEAEDLAFWVMQGGSGLSSDPTPERRQRVAKRMRVAWANDPLAFTEAEHYANFTLGRGVSPPQCADEDVQKIVERAWKANKRQLTSLDALRAISNELRAGANVYPIFYRGNGTVSVGFANADDVIGARPSDENRLEALWYVIKHVERTWSYENDGWKTDSPTTVNEVRYIPVLYAAAEDAVREDGKSTPPPPKAKLGDGEIMHLRLSRPLEGVFGVPHWQRSVPFFSALRRLVEARVEMQLAASSIIAKRVIRGGTTDVSRAAGNVMNQIGEIAAASERHPNAQRARPSGRTTLENDADRMEAMNLNSGAGNAQTDLAIVRGSAIAPSAMGQHYFGAGDDANLATASTMELPAAMAVGGYSQLFEDLLRTFTDVAIEEAVRAGELGGVVRPADGLPLSELRLNEEDHLAEAQQRTGKDLSYTFEMPYPGRRNLPDIVGIFNALMLPWPQGENEKGFELALQVLLGQGLNMENAPKLAKEIATEQQRLIKQAQDAQAAQMAPPPGAGGDQGQLDQYLASQNGLANPADGTSASQDTRNQDRPDTNRPAYGEKRQAATAKGDVSQYQSLMESALREGAYPDGAALADALGQILNARLRAASPVHAGRNGHG